jgi:hypothetical protein
MLELLSGAMSVFGVVRRSHCFHRPAQTFDRNQSCGVGKLKCSWINPFSRQAVMNGPAWGVARGASTKGCSWVWNFKSAMGWSQTIASQASAKKISIAFPARISGKSNHQLESGSADPLGNADLAGSVGCCHAKCWKSVAWALS